MTCFSYLQLSCSLEISAFVACELLLLSTLVPHYALSVYQFI